jgi:hypothetical protein
MIGNINGSIFATPLELGKPAPVSEAKFCRKSLLPFQFYSAAKSDLPPGLIRRSPRFNWVYNVR